MAALKVSLEKSLAQAEKYKGELKSFGEQITSFV